LKNKLIAALALAGFLLNGVSAQAETVQPELAFDAVQEITPGLVGETAAESQISITEIVSSGSVLVSDVTGRESNATTSIELMGVENFSPTATGISHLESAADASEFLVQPLDQGFRILDVIPNSTASNEFSFTIHAPSGTKLVKSLGSIRLELGDEILGVIRAPWAVDSNGDSVETHFELDGFTVTQVVDTNPLSAFPVIADPNWGYAFTFTQKNTPLTSWNALHTCFNCYFPVTGAPKAWPTYGTILNLKAVWENMQCMMSFVTTGTNLYRWKFNATSAHVDGYGSYITFELSKFPSTGKNRLIVDAFIVNDYKLGNAVYVAAAQDTWSKFASNLDLI
jgi:hypothetical protein